MQNRVSTIRFDGAVNNLLIWQSHESIVCLNLYRYKYWSRGTQKEFEFFFSPSPLLYLNLFLVLSFKFFVWWYLFCLNSFHTIDFHFNRYSPLLKKRFKWNFEEAKNIIHPPFGSNNFRTVNPVANPWGKPGWGGGERGERGVFRWIRFFKIISS